MQFSEVIGQDEARQRLFQMVNEQRIPHALLFTGPLGSGKMPIALAFASYLLGERTDGKSVLSSDAAIQNAEAMLKKWQHPDLHFSFPVIRPKGTSADRKIVSDDFSKEWHEMLAQGPYFTMDEWMAYMNAENQQALIYEAESDALNHKLNMKSRQGGYKVSIIWLPERMNLVSSNKLLKLLEEPPLQTVFLLVTEAPEQLLETIRSRVQRFDLHAIAEQDIANALTTRRGLEADEAIRLARVANGSWLKAIEALSADNENKTFFQYFVQLMRSAYMTELKVLKAWSENVASMGREKQIRMLTYFLKMTRESFVFNFGLPELNYMTMEEEKFAQNFAKFVNERNVVDMADLFQRTIRDIKQNANAKIEFFAMAMDLIIYLRR